MNKEIKVNQVIQVRKVFLLLILAFSLLVCGCGNSKSGQEIFQKSCETLYKLNNFSFKADLKITASDEKGKTTGNMLSSFNGDMMTEPEILHATMELDVLDEKYNSEMYYLEEKDNSIVYIKEPYLGWQKVIEPLDSEIQNNMFNPIKYIREYREKESTVKIVGKDETLDKVKLTILEVTTKVDSMSKEFIEHFTDSENPENVKEILASIGELKYKMWVRDDDFLITKIEINFKDMFKGLANNKKTDPKSKMFFQKASGKLVIIFYNYNQLEEIVVPDYVKNSAR